MDNAFRKEIINKLAQNVGVLTKHGQRYHF